MIKNDSSVKNAGRSFTSYLKFYFQDGKYLMTYSIRKDKFKKSTKLHSLFKCNTSISYAHVHAYPQLHSSIWNRFIYIVDQYRADSGLFHTYIGRFVNISKSPKMEYEE